ncbi:MAG TPA: hypothetical protein VK590_00410 [Saprospiraceae bacterium]|nr:hypothetical protein [Saprospiraceae bacterium]
MNNKEVIKRLTEYFLKQDPKDIAKALSACMIDFNRLMHADSLGEIERANLFMRVRLNVEELQRFLANPDNDEFSLINKDSLDD